MKFIHAIAHLVTLASPTFVGGATNAWKQHVIATPIHGACNDKIVGATTKRVTTKRNDCAPLTWSTNSNLNDSSSEFCEEMNTNVYDALDNCLLLLDNVINIDYKEMPSENMNNPEHRRNPTRKARGTNSNLDGFVAADNRHYTKTSSTQPYATSRTLASTNRFEGLTQDNDEDDPNKIVTEAFNDTSETLEDANHKLQKQVNDLGEKLEKMEDSFKGLIKDMFEKFETKVEKFETKVDTKIATALAAKEKEVDNVENKMTKIAVDTEEDSSEKWDSSDDESGDDRGLEPKDIEDEEDATDVTEEKRIGSKVRQAEEKRIGAQKQENWLEVPEELLRSDFFPPDITLGEVRKEFQAGHYGDAWNPAKDLEGIKTVVIVERFGQHMTVAQWREQDMKTPQPTRTQKQKPSPHLHPQQQQPTQQHTASYNQQYAQVPQYGPRPPFQQQQQQQQQQHTTQAHYPMNLNQQHGYAPPQNHHHQHFGYGGPPNQQNHGSNGVGNWLGSSMNALSPKSIRCQADLDQLAGLTNPHNTVLSCLNVKSLMWIKGSASNVGTLECGVFCLDDTFLEKDLYIGSENCRGQLRHVHSRIQQSGLDYSGQRNGPNILKALAMTDMPTLERLDNTAFVRYWQQMGQAMQNFNIGLAPIEVVKIGDQPWCLSIPGLGADMTDKNDRAVFQVLCKSLIQHEDAKLRSVIQRVSNRSQSGYALLLEIGTNVVSAFDLTKMLSVPTFGGNIYDYAEAFDAYFILAEKRGQCFTIKIRATMFLSALKQHVQVGMAEWLIATLPDSHVPTNGDWDLSKLAAQIDDSTSNVIGDAQVMQIQQSQYSVDTLSHQRVPRPPFSNSIKDNSLQGYLETVKRAYHRGDKPTRGRVPTHKHMPTPNNRRRYDRSINEGRVCDACHRKGHTAAYCIELARSAYIYQFIKDKRNKNEIEHAIENYDRKYKGKLTNRPQVNAYQLIDVVSEETGLSKEQICEEIQWDSFYPEDNDEHMYADDYISDDE